MHQGGCLFRSRHMLLRDLVVEACMSSDHGLDLSRLLQVQFAAAGAPVPVNLVSKAFWSERRLLLINPTPVVWRSPVSPRRFIPMSCLTPTTGPSLTIKLTIGA